MQAAAGRLAADAAVADAELGVCFDEMLNGGPGILPWPAFPCAGLFRVNPRRVAGVSSTGRNRHGHHRRARRLRCSLVATFLLLVEPPELFQQVLPLDCVPRFFQLPHE
jgi:hypothetical protein